jgi:hypothetical protein
MVMERNYAFVLFALATMLFSVSGEAGSSKVYGREEAAEKKSAGASAAKENVDDLVKAEAKKLVTKIVQAQTTRDFVDTAPAPEYARDLNKHLRKGGFLIKFRHMLKTEADQTLRSAIDTMMAAKHRIEPEYRQYACLSPQGIAEARTLNQIVKQLDFPISKVYVSPTCRTVETGEKAFGKVEIDRFVGTVFNGFQTAKAEKHFQKFLKEVGPGKNVVLVGHGDSSDPFGLKIRITLEESDAALYKVDLETGKVSFARRVTLADWASMLEKEPFPEE